MGFVPGIDTLWAVTGEEILVDGDYLGAIKRCHDSVGRAMYYTSVTIIVGFSILTLSNFIPTSPPPTASAIWTTTWPS